MPSRTQMPCSGSRDTAVILAHNHPSGITEPTRADELLTQSLKQSLDHIDYRILDRTTVVQISVMP